jgi:(2Fe-2S) ferredoxin
VLRRRGRGRDAGVRKGPHQGARLEGQGTGARINKSGCLDRCEEGPILVVYPEAVWYTYMDRDDVDEIIDRHIVKGEIVERLLI